MTTVSDAHSGSAAIHPDVIDGPFMRACRAEPTAVPPVWFMRQAGRSLPEYVTARTGTTMLAACATPDLVAEITMQPVRRYDVDAAIVYSDIVVPLKWAGVDVDIVPGVGPVMGRPVRTAADVDALPTLAPEQVQPLAQAISLLIAELGPKPLIGFAGAPFTVASYLVEGGPSKNHENTKAMMLGAPDVWRALMTKLVDITTTFLIAQITAGASAIQLFDSWVGYLSKSTYTQHVKPHSAAVLRNVAEFDAGRRVPRIHFGVGTGELLADMGDAGADVVGVDYRTSLLDGIARVGAGKAVQGNLDPAVLFAPRDVITAETRRIVDEGRTGAGHIFNLGHGVLPSTDPSALGHVVDVIRGAEVTA